MSKVADGVDFSFARLSGAQLKAAGKSFALRYVSPNAGKNLSSAEAQDFLNNGVNVGVFFEWYAQRAAEGHAAGVTDAQLALQEVNAMGFPGSIMFAIDWDIADYAPDSTDARAKLGPVADYFDGVISVLGAERTGGYGGFYAISRLFDAGLIKYACQTYAWSGGQWDDRAQLRQVLNGQTIDGQAVDNCEQWAEDAGLWTSSHPAPIPQPAPAPTPAPAEGGSETYTVRSGDNLGVIANLWQTTVQAIVNANDVKYPSLSSNPNFIQIGWVFDKPGEQHVTAAPNPVAGTYTVKSGDTLGAIAHTFGSTVAAFVAANEGTYPSLASNPNLIDAGWTFAIPGTGQVNYTVASGDTLGAIANKNFTTVAQLVAWNEGKYSSLASNPNLIDVGWVLRVK